MKQQTQQVITLLGSDIAVHLLARLRDTSATEAQLAASLGMSQPTVNRYLNALASLGLVKRSSRVETGRRGRPAWLWRIASKRHANTLEHCLDRCVARVFERHPDR